MTPLHDAESTACFLVIQAAMPYLLVKLMHPYTSGIRMNTFEIMRIV